MFSPIEHFQLNCYYKIYFFTDFFVHGFVVGLVVLNICLFWFWCFFNGLVVPTLFQIVFEKVYIFFFNLMKLQVGSYRALTYFHWLLAIFCIIFLLNYSSLIPYNISITGHIIITLYFSISFFIFFIILSFLNFRLYYFFYFYPKNVPTFLIGLLILIELLSFLIRPFSLAIRLFANMLAGHTLLNIFSAFHLYMVKKSSSIILIPFLFCFAIMFLEFGVAIIQAYVFFVLLSIYLNDCYSLH